MWVNVWLFQFIPLQPIDNQRFAKPVKDVGFLYENSRRQENAESMITFHPVWFVLYAKFQVKQIPVPSIL